MAQLDLTEREHQLLKSALESYLRELRGEIADTDAHDLRNQLKDEEKTLRGVLGRLEATKAAR